MNKNDSVWSSDRVEDLMRLDRLITDLPCLENGNNFIAKFQKMTKTAESLCEFIVFLRNLAIAERLIVKKVDALLAVIKQVDEEYGVGDRVHEENQAIQELIDVLDQYGE